VVLVNISYLLLGWSIEFVFRRGDQRRLRFIPKVATKGLAKDANWAADAISPKRPAVASARHLSSAQLF
jgi:hypothetical protein